MAVAYIQLLQNTNSTLCLNEITATSHRDHHNYFVLKTMHAEASSLIRISKLYNFKIFTYLD